MGGNLKIFIAFAFFGLALAELKIEGEYKEGVIKVNCTWATAETSYANKIRILRNDEKVNCTDGSIIPLTGQDQITCSCEKVTTMANTAGCSVVANATVNATDEHYVALINYTAEYITPEVAEVDVYVPATQVGKLNKTGEKVECVFTGVPAPVITWSTITDNKIPKPVAGPIKTESSWNPTSKLWETHSTFDLTRGNFKKNTNLICSVEQRLRDGNIITAYSNDFIGVNSAGKFGTPGLHVVLSLVYAFISKSII